MNKDRQQTHRMCIALLATLMLGGNALADDTEILLINPNATNPPEPNVLFIIDSSGSMKDEVETRVIYDPTRTYGAPAVDGCDPDMLYWTAVNAIPSCNAGNTQYIAKNAFNCDAASARLSGIGSYTNTFVQHREIGFLGTSSWQTLEPGNSSDIVECRRDRGVHGDGTAGAVYAQKGASTQPYSADAGQEIDWSSDSVSNAITIYDGNYLNYRQVPEFADQRKIDIVKDVTRVVMNSIEDVNVGVMRFNSNAGGAVIQGITDLNTNRAAIVNAIDGISPAGFTPLSETLYEAARYWRGMPAYYGEKIDDHPTDPSALASDDPEVYLAPASQACTKNFNVLLTDGAPVNDHETPLLVDNLPNWATALGHAGCTGNNQGDCLDDIAEYLFKEDISSAEAGMQRVTTHTIGFAINLPIMQAAAAASGGEYFLANDVESLTIALLKIVANIQEQSLSFTSPAVAVNSFNRTRNFNDLYLTTFGARGKVHWPGNLKKYRISDGDIVDRNGASAVDPATGFFLQTAQSYWSAAPDGPTVEAGGAANRIPSPDSRRVFTFNGSDKNLGAAANAISTANAGAYSLADFGLTGSATEPTKDEIIRWARGEDLRDENGDGDTTDQRFVMGDPLHSKPAAVVYGGSEASPDIVVYSATNDGYVHAINGSTGAELWSFVPKEHLRNFSKLYFNPDASYKHYGVDGDIIPVVKDTNKNGIIEAGDGDFVIIIFGMRRGGDSYYALDVTQKNSPRLLWQFQAPQIAQSWSAPTVSRIKMAAGAGQNADNAVVIFGAGYDVVHDTLPNPANSDSVGNGIFFVDLKSGNLLWRAGPDNQAQLQLADMTRAIPSAIRVIDMNGDGFANRMYATDMGGQIWRFDIFNGKDPAGTGTDALVTGGVLAQLGASGNLPVTDADTRRFYGAPDVSLFEDNLQNRRFLSISVGSGYRAHPLDNTTNERFYSIRDKNVFNALSAADYSSLAIIKESDLVEVSGTTGAVVGKNDGGWMFTLPADQKVLAESATFNNEIFFVAFSPDSVNAALCSENAGQNFLYRVSVTNGDPIADLDSIAAGDEDRSRVTDLAQGGIAPSPRFLFPSADDPDCTGAACSPPPIGCIGVECFDPDFRNNPVRTLWTQDGIE